MDQNLQGTTMNLNNLGGISNQNLNNVQQPVINNQPIQPISNEPVYTQPAYTAVQNTQSVDVQQPVYAQQPVYTQPAQTVAQSTSESMINTQPIQPVVENTQTEVAANTQPLSHPVVEKLEVTYHENDYKVKTKILQDIMNNVDKAIKATPQLALSSSTQLKFTSKGLEVVATDGALLYIVQVDEYDLYANELCIGINTQKFKNLLNKIPVDDNPEIEILYNATERIITVKMTESDGEFKFPEDYEIETGESLNIVLPEEMMNIPTIRLNSINDFQNQIKNMEGYSCPTESHKECQGVYIDKDSISATDRDNFAIGKAFPELAGKVVYFSNYFINAFKDVNFGEYAEIGFMQDEGYPTISRIILKGENATIIGPAMIPDYYEAYPIEGIMQFVRADLNQKLVVNRNKLIAAIERTQIFIANSDKDVIEFTFNPTGILINSKQSTAKETVTAKGCTSIINGRPVQANTILNFLRSLKAENITFEVDEKEERLFGIKSNDLTIIVSMYQE